MTHSQSHKAVVRVLTEALPYIRNFQKQIFVIKYGGNAMANERLCEQFCKDIVLLKLVGLCPLVVHGGGPQIDQTLQRLNIQPKKVNGMRVTDAATMEVVQMVLTGKINRDLVSRLSRLGAQAVGLSGHDANCFMAEPYESDSAHGQLGLVGRVSRLNPKLLTGLIERDFVPVIAPVATDEHGKGYNINADVVAEKVAIALNAEKLIFLTNAAGVLDQNAEVITKMTTDEAERLMQSEAINEGMIPKLQSALHAVRAGVRDSLIVDGRESHALLLEIFTDQGIGTLVCDR